MASDPPAPAALSPLPWAVWTLIIALAGIELVLWVGAQGLIAQAGSAGWRAQAWAAFAVSADLQGWMIETRQTPPRDLLRYLGYGFVQFGPLHVLLIVALTAGLGKFCAECLGSWRLLLLVALAQAAGGVSFGLFAESGAWLIGGHPLVFALAGCFLWLVQHGEAPGPARIPALALIAILVAGRIGLALVIGGMDWVADLTALGAGYALTSALRPGALALLRRR